MDAGYGGGPGMARDRHPRVLQAGIHEALKYRNPGCPIETLGHDDHLSRERRRRHDGRHPSVLDAGHEHAGMTDFTPA
jgi:hypothetical protein